jgi:TetR/AcrR family transcriptional regulator
MFIKMALRDAVKTRALILLAAEQIFAEVGLEGARTEKIAAAARVNKAMIFYYFQSKEGLYRAVLEANVKEFHQQAMAVFSGKGAARSQLLNYVTLHFDFVAARPYYPRLFHRLMMGGDARVRRIIQEHYVPLAGQFVNLLRRGMRIGEFRKMDPRHMAISLVGLTVFYFNAAPMIKLIGGQDPFDHRQLNRRKKEVLRQIRYVLFNHPEEAIA